MPIDEFTRKLRAQFIGGSDASAACGLDPWKSPYQLWAEKTGRAPGFKGSEAATAGTYFEPGLVNYLQDKLSVPISRDQLYVHSDGIRCANLDGIILSNCEPAIVEGKTVGLFGFSRELSEWGDETEGVNGVPQRVLIQVHHGFGVLDEHVPGVRLAHVIAFIGGVGFRHYRVPRNDQLVEEVTDSVRRFHVDFIAADRAPEDYRPSLELAKALIREPNKRVSVDRELVVEWRGLRDTRLLVEKAEKDAKARLLSALGDAEVGECDLGEVTFFESETAGYEVKPSRHRTLAFVDAEKLERRKKRLEIANK